MKKQQLKPTTFWGIAYNTVYYVIIITCQNSYKAKKKNNINNNVLYSHMPSVKNEQRKKNIIKITTKNKEKKSIPDKWMSKK